MKKNQYLKNYFYKNKNLYQQILYIVYDNNVVTEVD